VTKRKKNLLVIQVLVFFTACTLIYFTYYYNVDPKLNLTTVNEKSKNLNKKDSKSGNIFKDVVYKGLDLNGNRYEINAAVADFELETPELINMQIMDAKFKFKDGTTLYVRGDWGIYNNKTNDIKFRENIKATYLDSTLYADNLDFLNSKNLLNIYKNVRTYGPDGSIIADNLNFNLSDKTLDVSMFDSDMVNVKLKNK